MSLVIALVLAAASQTTANSALSDWMPGLATNYGGPSEGMNPDTPSYGLKEVSLSPKKASFNGLYMSVQRHTVSLTRWQTQLLCLLCSAA